MQNKRARPREGPGHGRFLVTAGHEETIIAPPLMNNSDCAPDRIFPPELPFSGRAESTIIPESTGKRWRAPRTMFFRMSRNQDLLIHVNSLLQHTLESD